MFRRPSPVSKIVSCVKNTCQIGPPTLLSRHLGQCNTVSSLCTATKDDSKHNFCPLRMDNKPEECPVCLNNYDDNLQRPRTLPCGHTFCSQCIDNAIKNGQLTCPSCRAQHVATAATQFPINYAVEAFVRKLKNIQLTTEEVVPAKLSEAPNRGISKKLCSMVQEQKSNISSLITSCEEVLSQLGEYRGQLGDWKTDHLHLQDRLYALVEQNKSAMELLELEDTNVVDMTTQGEEGKTQLQAMLGSLDTVNAAQEVFMTINEVDQCNMVVEDWLQKCQELFPTVKTVYTSLKVQKTIREALEMITTDTGATADPVHLGDTDSSIMNKVKKISGEIHLKQITVEDLRRMREPIKSLVEAGRVLAVKRLVEAGQVLAVHEDQDGCCSARITLQDGQLYLHPLLRQPTPAHAHTLQESEVVGVLDPSCTLAFLDLGWAGSTRGRVTIRLTPDTPLARQFVLLCTGQRGHTFRNTKLLWVMDKGEPGEWVVGGDYESNDGEGGAPLLPNLQGQYRGSGRAGAVSSWWAPGSPTSAQFTIITRDHQDGPQWLWVFGDVVSGLDVVRAAVNHSDITEVTVVDCGVVLPL
ncbi:E3 ubiquitin-protein ligase TRIM69 isoform X1 [Procambarus clarkii]|uniref:E3 ubiquitin-protein ligase TRIM69 isoform X1 n=1 Tax=Procambarus clarkii TaxID=6728 RepID=UPI0037446D3A